MLSYLHYARDKAYREDACFYFATGVTSVRQDRDAWVLGCTATKFLTAHRRGFDQVLVGFRITGETRDMDLILTGVSHRSFRIRYGPGAREKEQTLMAPCVEETPLDCTETPHGYRFRSGTSILEVVREPFSLRLLSEEGEVLLDMPGIQACHPNAQGAGEYASLKDFFPFGLGEEQSTFTTALSNGEKIYGLGERFSSMDRRGNPVEFYHQDAAGNEGIRTYKNIPFYISSRGYGVYVNSAVLMDFDIGVQHYDFATVFLAEECMDVFLIPGPDLKEVLRGYAEITGFPSPLPRWSYGLWMSRNSYETRDIALGVARELRSRHIPCDVIHLDTFWFDRDWVCDLKFSPERFPDPKGMMQEFAGMGFHVSLWQLPFVHPEIENYKTGSENGYFIKRQDGSIYPFHWFGKYYAMIDFSNEEAVNWYMEQIGKALETGAAAIKTDMPENCPPDGVYQGARGVEMHNLFPLIYNKAIYEKTREVTGEGIVWARSTYAGGQRYPLPWSGDARSTFGNLAGALRGGLAIGLSGQAFWSHDIGGFIGRPSPRLYVRWAQLGLLSSHARCHGGGNRNPREPWAYGEEAEQIFKKYCDLRYRLLPYLFSIEAECCETGLPFLRHLVLYHQDDRNTHAIDDQYYFGPNLLVCPVVTEEDRRAVYLPRGLWYEFETGRKVEGGTWTEIEVPLDTLPMYVPAGAILVLGPPMERVDGAPLEELEIRIYAGRDGTFRYANGKTDVIFRQEWKDGRTWFHDGGYRGNYRVVTYG